MYHGRDFVALTPHAHFFDLFMSRGNKLAQRYQTPLSTGYLNSCQRPRFRPIIIWILGTEGEEERKLCDGCKIPWFSLGQALAKLFSPGGVPLHNYGIGYW